MNDASPFVRHAVPALQRLLSGLEPVRIRELPSTRVRGTGIDCALVVSTAHGRWKIALIAKARVTPQTALWIAEQAEGFRDDAIPVVYAPVISPRVAQILQASGVGYLDAAGNARLRSARHGLFIDHKGRRAVRAETPAAANPFSPRSSRIVRLALSAPAYGWKVRELANHPDVQVSPGLVVKVKKALLAESYAVQRDGLLLLRDPFALLENWTRNYPGPAEQIPMYFLGGTEEAEQAIAHWCRDNGLKCALAGYAAAWRLAPEVRYSVSSIYIEESGFRADVLTELRHRLSGKRVDSGANVMLWRPFDRSVFVGSEPQGPSDLPVTSPIQSYLDVKRLAGRGQEAADPIFQTYLEPSLRSAMSQFHPEGQ